MSFFWHLKLALLHSFVLFCKLQLACSNGSIRSMVWFPNMASWSNVRKSLRSQSADWHWDGIWWHDLSFKDTAQAEATQNGNEAWIKSIRCAAVSLHLRGHCQRYTYEWKPPRGQIEFSFILQQPFSCSNQNMREPWSEFPPILEDVNSWKKSLQKSFPHGPDASVCA